MDILDEKVRYEQEIRILKEQREQDKKEMDGVMLSDDFREGKVIIKIYTNENSKTV